MTEPVSLDSIKVHLRLDPSDPEQDDYLDALLLAARRAVEHRINRSVVGTDKVLELDAFPGHTPGPMAAYPLTVQTIDAKSIMLPGGSVSAVASITYRDGAGTTVTIDPASYINDFARLPGRVSPVAAWPVPGKPALIRVAYTVSPLAAEDLAVVAQAVKLLVEGWFANRGSVAIGATATEIPNSVSWLLAPLRQFAND